MTLPAQHRVPVEIWTEIIGLVVMSEIWPYITFVPGCGKHFFDFIRKEMGTGGQVPIIIPHIEDWWSMRHVSKSWKTIVDSYGYLFRTHAVNLHSPPVADSPCTEEKEEEAGALIMDCSQWMEGIDGPRWASLLKAHKRVLYIKIVEPLYTPSSAYDILLSHSQYLTSLTSLELQLEPTGDGILSQMSVHFPRLVNLDIRIRFLPLETSIIDVVGLRLPHLVTLTLDTDRWALFDEAFLTWELPGLEVIALTANGGCYADSNPTAASVFSFFLKFGRKVTHACLYVCVLQNHSSWQIQWESVPNLVELITHPGIDFKGAAPLESKLTRVTVTEIGERCMTWLSAAFDFAFDQRRGSSNRAAHLQRKFTVCLEYGGGEGDAYEGPNESELGEQAVVFRAFCQTRGWILENGTSRK